MATMAGTVITAHPKSMSLSALPAGSGYIQRHQSAGACMPGAIYAAPQRSLSPRMVQRPHPHVHARQLSPATRGVSSPTTIDTRPTSPVAVCRSGYRSPTRASLAAPRRTNAPQMAAFSHQPPTSQFTAAPLVVMQNGFSHPSLLPCNPSVSSFGPATAKSSAPALSLGKLHTLADAEAIRGDYSPRDSVWKRHFCNASDDSAVKQSPKTFDFRERVPRQVNTEMELDAFASVDNGCVGTVAPDTPSTIQRTPGLRHEDVQLRSPRPGQRPSSFTQQNPLTPVAQDPPVQQLAQELLIEQYAHPSQSAAQSLHERVRPSQPRTVQVQSPSDTPEKVLVESHPASPSSRSMPPNRSASDSPSRRLRQAKAVGYASDGTAEAEATSHSQSRPPYADALNAVASCARAISLEDLSELGALARPHAAVREVVESALMLLGYRDATWSAARARLERPESFLEKLLAFDPSRDVSRLQYQKLRRSLEAPRIAASVGGAEGRCRACGGLEHWSQAIGELLAVRYGDPPLANTHVPKVAQSSLPGTPHSSSSALQQGVLQQEVLSPPVPRPDLGDLVITPDIYSLAATELRQVRELTIHKPSVGEVTFHGSIDLVREHDILEELPSLVRLDPGEVVLYPDASTKPREGEGLNRPATITLFNCMPPSNAAFPDAESKQRYRDRIAQMTESKGAHFVDYDCERGIWRFRVEHF